MVFLLVVVIIEEQDIGGNFEIEIESYESSTLNMTNYLYFNGEVENNEFEINNVDLSSFQNGYLTKDSKKMIHKNILLHCFLPCQRMRL